VPSHKRRGGGSPSDVKKEFFAASGDNFVDNLRAGTRKAHCCWVVDGLLNNEAFNGV